jgi:lipopolysaccharide transport system ATP-binding protein
MIKINNLNFSYPIYGASARSLRTSFLKNTKIHLVNALKEINLTINQGERVGLVGHNGSGKSTLLKIISGIYYPSEGDIVLNEDVYSILDFTSGVVKDATGYENILISAYFRGLKKNQIEDRIDWIIDFSELKEAINLPVRTYSSGMYVRLISSILLSQYPKIFVLDEFFGAGDKNFVEKVRKQILKMIKNSGIFIFASHDEVLLKSLCNRIITLENGSIIKDIKI